MSSEPTPSRRVQKKRARARARIIDAAREVVVRDGYANLTIESVAAEADVSKPSVYYYFDSKEAVVRALAIACSADDAGLVITAVERALPGGEVVEAVVRTYVERCLESLNLFRVEYVWAQIIGPDADDSYSEADESMVELFDAIQASLVRDAEQELLREGLDLRRTAVSIWTAAHGLASMLSILDMAESRLVHTTDSMIEELCTILRGGIYR